MAFRWRNFSLQADSKTREGDSHPDRDAQFAHINASVSRAFVSYRVIPGSSPGTDLISATTTETGLTVQCELDTSTYPKGIAMTDQEMSNLNILRDDFHGEWNYEFGPCDQQDRAANS